MDDENKRHYGVAEVCTHFIRTLPIKSVVVAKGDTIEEMILSFKVSTEIHTLVDILEFVSSSNNLSYKFHGSFDLTGTMVYIIVDLSLPF